MHLGYKIRNKISIKWLYRNLFILIPILFYCNTLSANNKDSLQILQFVKAGSRLLKINNDNIN